MKRNKQSDLQKSITMMVVSTVCAGASVACLILVVLLQCFGVF